MRALLLKDFYRFKTSMLLIGALTVYLAAFSKGVKVTPNTGVILLVGLAVNSYGYEDGWSKYCKALPFSDNKLVYSRYLFPMVLLVGSSLLHLVVSVLSLAVRGQAIMLNLRALELLVAWAVVFIMMAVTNPLFFGTNSENARAIISVLALLSITLIVLLFEGMQVVVNFLTINYMWLVVGIVGLLVLSVYVSKRLYVMRKKRS